jgi:flagellar basal-body rod modification protein FlgD
MKNLKIIFASLLISSLTPLSADTLPCISDDTNSRYYILRENDRRCEGIKAPKRSASFELISFTTGQIPQIPLGSNFLNLQVPGEATPEPKIAVENRERSYYLDPIKPINYNQKTKRFQLRWSDNVIQNVGIPLDQIYATATINDITSKSTNPKYIPVIFDRASGVYKFVFWTNQRTKITKFEIRQQSKTIFKTSRPNFQPKGEISISWDGRSTPAGNYQLLVEAELEQSEEQPPINLTFQHNPQWLK